MKKIRQRWRWGVAAAAFLAVLAICGGLFRNYFNQKVNQERISQINELVNQVGTNFISSLDASWDSVAVAKNLAQRYEYEDASSISLMADWLNNMTEVSDNGGFFFLLDETGRCYDASGSKGMWVDFDRVGTSEQATFIADSQTFDGYYWAFVQKLDESIEVQDGSASVSYVVLMRTTASMESSFASSAYQDVGETYVLQENGVRMYDNLNQEDTLDVYNIFNALRKTESVYGSNFTVLEERLQEQDVASSDCIYEGRQYCYSIYHIEKYNTMLLFLLPADAVAVNTVDMVSAMVWMLLVAAALIVVLATGTGMLLMRAQGRARMLEQQERTNEELLRSNRSMAEASRVAEQALAVAESANRAKSSFLSNMSHDIRTPLNAILGFQKLMAASDTDPDKMREYSEKIAVAGNHLLSLVNDILDMSRIESGKTALHPEPFRLGTLVEELGTVVMPQAQAKQQEFCVQNDTEDLFLLGDRPRLNQILTNILSNAVKYTPNGGRIVFQIERLDTEHRGVAQIRFRVQDNGIGMGEEFQKRIFEPFSREESALISGISGTGLGMSITKNLVDLMGGIILVESRRGEGSTFTVEMSFRLEDTNQTADSVEESTDLTDALKGRHLLMAEDNGINAEILTDLLEMEGATCDVAENGKKAVELFEASAPGTYDAILMDVQMPVMDGYEAARRIRESSHPEAATIPIAALTANAFAEDVQKALEAGMNTHISKPVDMQKLREFIATSCERREG